MANRGRPRKVAPKPERPFGQRRIDRSWAIFVVRAYPDDPDTPYVEVGRFTGAQLDKALGAAIEHEAQTGAYTTVTEQLWKVQDGQRACLQDFELAHFGRKHSNVPTLP